MERKTVVIPEKKIKIEKIKEKYNNLSMKDETAKKIIALELTNGILKAATVGAGLITVIDYFIPDPVPIIDEAILTGITTLLGTSTKIVQNKIDELAVSDNTTLKMEEINKLTHDIRVISNTLKNKKITK